MNTLQLWVETMAMNSRAHEHAAHDIEAKGQAMAESREIGFFEHLENLFSHGLNLANRDLS